MTFHGFTSESVGPFLYIFQSTFSLRGEMTNQGPVTSPGLTTTGMSASSMTLPYFTTQAD